VNGAGSCFACRSLGSLQIGIVKILREAISWENLGWVSHGALAIFLAFGLAFEIPIAVYLCIWAGLAEPESLTEKRPYVVVGCFVAAMLLTPPDPFTQSMLAIPMWALFEAEIIAGKIARKRQRAGSRERTRYVTVPRIFWNGCPLVVLLESSGRLGSVDMKLSRPA